MGFSQCNHADSESHEHKNPPPNSLSIVHNYDDDDENYCGKYNDEPKLKSFLMKMMWDFGLGCFMVGGDKIGKKSKSNNSNPEHNKAWLLAESGGDLANKGEPHSLHSSFRFNICSQVELDTMKATTFENNNTTVLTVNLDCNLSDSSSSKEVKWERFQYLEKSISPIANSLVRFSYGEIVAATRSFSQGRVLGRGALSYVYRGRVGLLRTAVAIKRLDTDDKESSKAFCRELMIANSLEHPNIVPLLGFCIDPEQGLFLVYKYVSSGSLERHLHGKRSGGKEFSSLSWSVRYKVAVGIAEAIAYLHNGTERCIVHRDIKPSNILLSSKKRPKLCDFGLATWTPAPSVPFLCKTVKGTFGYLAPEYFQNGKVSDKTDVYAFGVVLLELLTGRKPIEATRPLGEENLVQWAKPLIDQGEPALDTLLDPRAKLTCKSSMLISQMVRAAAACVSSDESSRPAMDEALTLLRGESCPVKGKSGFGWISYGPHVLQRTKSEMRNHFALAMLGVSELDDDDYLYGR